MQFTQRYWIIAASLLSLVLGTSVGQAQPAKLLPNDTELIATINLAQVLKSEAVKTNKEILDGVKAYMTKFLDDKELSKYLKKADVDVFRDLHSMTVAVPGAGGPRNFVVLEGKLG